MSGIDALRAALETDGYLIDVRDVDGRVEARISATAGACEDCLVPKPVFRAMLRQALGVPEDAIDLRYPGE